MKGGEIEWETKERCINFVVKRCRDAFEVETLHLF